ncbi:hypothetical protein L1049_006899 [Liquidambar formosana]|uniref:Uncharacterized protein n=1 Tax=Liquidambar formosana TaxID=63359 RepID=A0AAP0WRK3_LIQFO
MAETPLKRQRDETQLVEEIEDPKRQKSYNHILSLLEADEEEPQQDLSSLMTTLENELSYDSAFDPLAFSVSETDPENPATGTTSDYGSSSPVKEEEEDDKERVIRHLLEASDDELGIPHRDVRVGDGEDGFNGGDGFSFCDGLWELEDEAANYYTLLQSELFM